MMHRTDGVETDRDERSASRRRMSLAASMQSIPPSPRTRRKRSALGPVRPLGGMIAIGGPPLGGKSVLAARLAECLPFAARLEAIDDLSHGAPYLQSSGPRPSAAVTTAVLLGQAKQLWTRTRGRRYPTILVVTRFGSAHERRRAKLHAELVGMPFLFVEVTSRDQRSLLRIPMNFLSKREIEMRLRRHDEALRRYTPVDRAEALALPALKLKRVLSGLEDAVDQVVAAWMGG